MKLIEFNAPSPNISIEVLGDLHIGSAKFNYELFMQRLARVRDNPNTYCIVLGDIINNSTKDSVGDTYTETLSPMEQIRAAKELLYPIKDKILAITSGNHERRSYKKEGVDLTYFLACELGINDRYDYCACLLMVTQPTHPRHPKVTTIYITHGDGNGGRTVGGKANGLSRRGDVVNADIIVTGHTHTPIVFKEASYEVDKIHHKIKLHEQLFVNCGATLDYEEYAELYGMKPSTKANPTIYLSAEDNVATL